MNDFKKRFLAFSSHVICSGLMLILFYIMLCAFLNDNHVNVYINNHGEVYLELILVPLTLIFCSVGLWFAWCSLKKTMQGEYKK